MQEAMGSRLPTPHNRGDARKRPSRVSAAPRILLWFGWSRRPSVPHREASCLSGPAQVLYQHPAIWSSLVHSVHQAEAEGLILVEKKLAERR